MFTPRYLMVFDHDIILESLAIILLHLALWRGPMRKQSDFFYINHHCLADEVLFHSQTILAGERKPRESTRPTFKYYTSIKTALTATYYHGAFVTVIVIVIVINRFL